MSLEASPVLCTRCGGRLTTTQDLSSPGCVMIDVEAVQECESCQRALPGGEAEDEDQPVW